MDILKTVEKERAFLCALMETCNVTLACKKADVGRATVYAWREADEKFAVAWDRAKRIGAEALEDEAMRRAKEGVDEPVFYKGDECGTIRKYSDTLAIFLLKGAMPDKYKDRVEHSGNLDISARIVDARKRAGG